MELSDDLSLLASSTPTFSCTDGSEIW